MKNRFTFYLFLIGLVCLLSRAAIAQTTRYVSTTGTNSDPASATSWATATTDLQGAINSLTATGGEVWVAAGLYKPTSTTARTISFAMANNVSIYGGFEGNESSIASRPVTNPVTGNPSSSTLSGEIGDLASLTDNSHHVISNPKGLTTTAVLDGFVITSGYANGNSPDNFGGGVLNDGTGTGQYCNPSFRNCLFQSNAGTYGAAMNNSGNNGGDSSPILTNCIFQSNTAAVGGAILNDANNGNSSPVVNNCLFKSNIANVGGAVYNSGITGGSSSPTLNNCVFLSNSAKLYGGAIINLTNASGNSSPKLTNCLFQSNTAVNTGGVMYNQAGTNCTCNPTLTNCAFLSNVASLSGGAFHNYVGTGTSNIVLTNCSFQSNSATNSGGLAYSEVGTGLYSFSLINCVLWNNGGSNTFNNSNGTVSLAYSLFDPSSLLSNIDTSSPGNLTATVSPFASTTSLQLNACAPAINTGNNSATGLTGITTDLAGNPRILGGKIDMGAYEFQGTPTSITLTNPSTATALVSTTFSQAFSVSGGSDPYSFTLLTGSLPAGLSLASTGVLSGTPTQNGTFTMVVQGTDAAGCVNAGSTYTLTVNTAIPTLTGFAPTLATVCTGQITTFTATIGNVTGAYDYTLTNGTSTTSGTSSNSTFNQSWTAGGYGAQSFSLIISSNGSVTTASTTLTVGSVISNAAINYWGGCISSDWQTASNWSKGTVPVATDDVVLLATAPNQPVLNGTGLANSVEAPANTTLTIGSSGTLSINGSRAIVGNLRTAFHNEGTVANSGVLVLTNIASVIYSGVYNKGTFTNRLGGSINIDNSSSEGLHNTVGTFSNAGIISIGKSTTNASGIWNESTFDNVASGQILIDRSKSYALNNYSGTFTNSATITIGSSATIGSYGLFNGATFSNNSGGLITIDRSASYGINNSSGSFTNSATITVGTSATSGQYGISNSAILTNTTGGLITIDNALFMGLYNTGVVTNSSTIAIGATASTGAYGLRNSATFTNEVGGEITIARSTTTALQNDSNGSFTNSSTVTIGSLFAAGTRGLYNLGVFNNGATGLIRIDRSSIAGLYNTGTFNNSAPIVVGQSAAVGQYGIQNQGTFNNIDEARIIIDRSSIAGLYNTYIFSNSAVITIGASANVGQYGLQNLFGTFTNTGGGQINIDRSSSGGLIHAGTFTNSATITIGANAAVGDIALGVAGSNGIGTFSNNAGGLITLAGSSIVGLDNYLSTFINAGTIRAGHLASVGQYGVRNRGFFTNTTGGSIHVDGATGTGLLNELGAFTNSSTILIGSVSAVGATGVSNGTATFNNSGCAALLKVMSDAVITNSVSGTFTNTGTIIENASGNSTISSNAGLVLNQNGGTFNTGSGPNQPLSSTATSQTSCSPADGALTFSGLQANTTYSFSYTVNGNATQVSPDPTSNANGELTLTNLSGGVYSINLSGNCVAQTLPLTATIASNIAPPSLTISSSNATLSCASPTVSLSAIGNGTVKWSTGELSSVINVTSGGTYSVTLTAGNGCSSTTSTSISNNTTLVISAGASLPQANLGVVISLTASGASSYQWSNPATAQLTTPATGSAISVSLTTAGVQTFTVVGTTGACSQSALVSVTALAGPDLSAIMSLPDGNFQARESKGLLMQLQEVNGATASGSIMITITVPVGYSVSFDNSLTSINVSGGSNNPVAVQNTKWQISSSLAGQQLSLALNGGESVAASSTINLGFSITRTTANAGSVSNITVNVADDGRGQYDVNRLNNVYARIITGL
ncbi:beta strand repeat-containing protein [Spirosoma gilvum]